MNICFQIESGTNDQRRQFIEHRTYLSRSRADDWKSERVSSRSVTFNFGPYWISFTRRFE